MNAIAPIITDLDSLRSQCPSIFQTEKAPARSEKYTFISTMDQIKALMAEGFQVAAARQSRCRNPDNIPFTKHMVRLRAPGLGNNELAPEVILTNSHNGGGCDHLMGGAFRFFCFNGLVVSEGQIESIRIPHKGDVLKDVIEGVITVMSHARGIVRVHEQWSGVELSGIERLDFAERALALRFGRTESGNVDTPITVRQVLEPRRDQDAGDDLWRVFNRVQEHIIVGGLSYQSVSHNSGRTKIRNIKSRPVRGIDQDVKLNQSLWALAEEFALAA